MNQWWVRDATGEVRGPHAAWEIQQAVHTGAWSPHIEVSADRMHWGPVASLPAFQQQAAAPPGTVSPLRNRIGGAVFGVLMVLGGIAQIFNSGLFSKPPRASVNCQTAVGVGFQCRVQHLEGRSSLEVCWDLAIMCRNGARAVGHACENVQRGATSTRLIPVSEVTNANACDLNVSMALENLVVRAR